MKLLLDQNLSPRLVALLQELFPGTAHVSGLGLQRADDETVWKYARDGGFAILSKDTDFYQRSMVRGAPPKVVWVSMGNCSTEVVLQCLMDSRDQLREFESDKETSFLVLGW